MQHNCFHYTISYIIHATDNDNENNNHNENNENKNRFISSSNYV